MTPVVGGVVMAHPDREAFVAPLCEKLGGVGVVWDERNDRFDTGLRALQAWQDWSPEPTHFAIIQDDALVCRDLLDGLAVAVTHSGNRPVGLYLGTVRPVYTATHARLQHARSNGWSFAVAGGPYWGVGMCLPTDLLPELCTWFERSRAAGYDTRIAHFFAKRRRCWYTVPSLVDHRDGPSLVPGRRAAGRRAQAFIGEDASALDIDWARTPTQPEEGYVTAGRIHVCFWCERSSTSEPAIAAHVRRHQ